MIRFVVLLMGLVLSACGVAKEKSMIKAIPSPTEVVFAPVVVEMIQIDKTGQKGIATIKQEGEKARVIINLDLGRGSQPAHVHYGVCPQTGVIKYVLNDLIDGSSETVLDVPMRELVASGSMAINVHKSTNDYETIVSCGDIEL